MNITETKEWQRDHAEQVANAIEKGGKLLISITPPARNSLTWKYEVRLAYVDKYYGGQQFVNVINLTYWLAQCLGKKVNANGQLRDDETGTHRGFVVAYKVWGVLASFGLVDAQFTNQAIYETL